MIFQYFRSIRVLFSVYLGIILLFIYLGLHFYQGDKARESAERSRELGSIARLKYSALLQWYTERYADARYIFSNESLYRILNSSRSSTGDSSEVVPLIYSIYRNHDYSNLFLMDPSTNDILNLNPNGSDDILKDSLNAALKDNRIVNSDFYIDKNLNKPCLDIYIPISLSNRRKVAIVLKVDPYKILFPSVSSWYIDASSGESLIVTASSDSIYYFTPLKFYHNTAQILKKPLTDFDLPAAKVINGARGVVSAKDYRGTDVLADVHRFENTPWYLVTKMDLSEIYEPVTTNTLNNLLIMGLLISLGGILLLYYYTRSNYNNLRNISNIEKKFKNIFNNATEAIIILNKEQIIDCNPGAEKLYGLPRKKIIGKSPGSLSPEYQPGHKRSKELASELLGKVLEGEPQKFEWIHINNGNPIYTDVNLVEIEVDGEKLVAGFLHDISERKLMEDALYESEKMYRLIFDSAPVGIYQSTPEGKVIKANKALAELLGYGSAEELCRVAISDIYLDKKDRQTLINEFEPTGTVSDREVQWKKKDGNVIWIQLNAFAVKDDNGKTKHFEGYVRDITSRKLAENKLKESEAQYRDLVENINDIVFSLNHEGIITFISSAVEKFTGYKIEELIGKPFKGFIYPGDLPLAVKNFHNLSAKKSALSEYRLITKSGELRCFSASSTGIFDQNEFVGIRGILTDISEKREADEKLKIQTHLLNETQHLARLGSWEHDYGKNRVFWSDEIYEILGTEKEWLGSTEDAFYEFVHKDDLNSLLSAYDDSRNEGGMDGFELEHRIVRKDNGRVRFVYQECRHFRNSEGKIVRSIGMLQDITERVVAGKHIQTLTKAVEQSPVCVVITDLDGNIQYVNNKFSEVTGYSLNEVINKNPRILKSGTQGDEFYKELWKTILSGNTWSGELHNKKKNGELYWEYAIISPIVDAGGKILNFVAVKEDITEKKKMIEDLVEAKNKAEESNRLKSSFLANMSHELRTPMVGILGYTDILVSELTNSEHTELAKMVLSSGKRLIETLNSILDLSSIEAKKMELKLEPVDAARILKESVSLFAQNAVSKGLYLKSILPDNLFINSDREMLNKIFNNLINNAVKYTQSGGITVELSLTNNGDGKNLKVSVTDTGIGISPEYHEIIFEPFRQVSEGYTRKFEGSGLGLSITNKLVKMLDGSIYLESIPGKGSRFIVNIPVAVSMNLPKKDEIQLAAVHSYEFREDLSILLVEDDELNANIILSYLKPICSVEHASGGETAIECCKNRKYDTILMDINLKGMNGIEAMERIRKMNKYYQTIPVIAVTALAMSGDREKLLSVGFDNYLSKPFERTQLLQVLSESLKPGKLFASSRPVPKSASGESR